MKDDSGNRFSVKRVAESEPVKVSLKFAFHPKAIGPERTAKIWDGMGKMLAGLLTPEEAAKFLEQGKAQLEKRGKR